MTALMDVLAPLEQEGTKAVVRAWLKRPGETVNIDDPLVELETDKVTQEVPSPVAGILAEILLQSGDDAGPGSVLGRIRAEGARHSAPAVAAVLVSHETAKAVAPDLMRYSPAVRHAALQYGIDPGTVAGTGKNGRVTRIDIEAAFAARSDASPSIEPTSQSRPVPPPAEAHSGRDKPAERGSRSVPHSPMRLAIASNMLNSVTVAPHVTAVFEADFSAILKHREANKAALAARGTNLSYTAYMVAAAAAAMRAVPEINSRWHDDHLEIFDDVNIGVGTALGDKGLVVPVIRRVQHLSLTGIATALQDLTARARAGTLKPEDMRSGTFTISNHGVSGSLFASPIIINQPQTAILGIGKLEKRVVVREVGGVDTIQIRPMAYVSLTIDHRAVDGHQTNLWLTRFVEVLENWPA
ncbi:2-oxoglutarate dehydrogenase E2 component (dihydrolipoamide succinyltransferase) [Mycoplana sp. BE70]|uniref:dihydrolipoamide acetyltransferase family protein n=1 Tax=Mycoplana sp. BE70 TaxID=2817775 RepID=UPI00285F751C|nr:2-oxo acid dehydrogenase subunit E2 [Mycoplana sp. BE70]MDR6755858.1 2-oxoglutarate dehydrogenase E2 component (dihydrolipoamide succinyltransferase) [Mycoplana sp. BE70]